MRRGYRKVWWVVPCISRKSLRTESMKDIEEILKTKLATINEEPEMCEENQTPTNQNNHRHMAKKGKKIHSKVKMGRYFVPQFSLKDSYVLFITGFASKGSLGGFIRY